MKRDHDTRLDGASELDVPCDDRSVGSRGWRYEFLMALMVGAAMLLAGAAGLSAQMHDGNWVRWNGADTILVRCLNDSASTLAFPPGCFSRMGMSGDSIYCQFQYLPMDSIPFPVDTAFLCWRRLQIGADSASFGYMNCRGGSGGGAAMMQFLRTIRCRLRWDTTLVGPMRRHWHPTGVRCWDGTRWVAMSGVQFSGAGITFTTTTLYAAMAVVGEPDATSAVATGATREEPAATVVNHPNPFSGTTVIELTLPRPARVTAVVFDTEGRSVATLRDDRLDAGRHALPFDGSSLPSGSYLYRISVDDEILVGRAILVR